MDELQFYVFFIFNRILVILGSRGDNNERLFEIKLFTFEENWGSILQFLDW